MGEGSQLGTTRFQLNGPNAYEPLVALVLKSIVNCKYSIGLAGLVWATIRWKFGTLYPPGWLAYGSVVAVAVPNTS